MPLRPLRLGGLRTAHLARPTGSPALALAEEMAFGPPGEGRELARILFSRAGADAAAGVPQADGQPSQPYLVWRVRLDADEVLYWGELDRETHSPSGGVQILAELLGVSDLTRELHPDARIPIVQTTLRIRNDLQDKSHFFRKLAYADGQSVTDPSILRATFELLLCYSGLGFSAARVLTPLMRLERVVSITPAFVELELVDDLPGQLGTIQQLPTLGEVAARLRGSTGSSRVGSLVRATIEIPQGLTVPEGREEERLRVQMGRSWLKPALLEIHSVRRLNPISLADLLWVLAISKRPFIDTYYSEHPYTGIRLPAFRFARFTDSSAEELFPGFAGSPVTADDFIFYFTIIVDLETWYVAALWADLNQVPNSGQGQVVTGANSDYAYITNNPEDFWVSSTAGAEGSWGRDVGRDPASIIEEIARLYCEQEPLPAPLPQPTPPYPSRYDLGAGGTFEETRRAYAGTVVAGVLESGQRMADVIAAICSSHQIDPYLSIGGRGRRAGKLCLRPQGVTEKDLSERIPVATEITAELDIGAESFRETIPLANERWGMANSGVAKNRPEWMPKNWDGRAQSGPARAYQGREIERDIDLGWLDRPLSRRGGGELSYFDVVDHLQQRTVARLLVHLGGAELEIGDWARVTHHGGFAQDGGYVRRLFRVEGTGLAWGAAQVPLALVDHDEIDRFRPYVLDDEDLWLRWAPGVAQEIAVTATSTTVVTTGWTHAAAGVQVGDELVISPASGYDSSEGFVSRISDISAPGSFEVEDPLPQTVLTVSDFEIRRTYETPPDDAARPGKYPGLDDATDLYGSLCDETLPSSEDDVSETGDDEDAWREGNLGSFDNNGDPGYTTYT